MARHGYRPSDPSRTGDPDRLVRSGQEHKREQPRGLLKDLLQLRWLLVGDDGQHPRQVRRGPPQARPGAGRAHPPAQRDRTGGQQPDTVPKDAGADNGVAFGEGPVLAGDRFRLRQRLRERNPPGPGPPLSAHPERGRAQDVGMSAPPPSETRSPIRT